MAALTGNFISQSYGGLIHLTTNTGIVSNTPTMLQDGLGNNLNLYVNSNGSISGSSFTGSLFGTASQAVSASWAPVNATSSYALQSLSSSYALTASFASNVPATASYALQALSASFATSASFASSALTASYVLNAVSSSFATSASRATSASTASFVTASNVFGPFGSNSVLTASFATSASFASNALTASFALNASGAISFPYTGSAVITGSLTVTGSAFGNVVALTISSNTASVDLTRGSYFTLTLPTGNTFLNITNPRPGITANLVITTNTNSSASFSSNVKLPATNKYIPTSLSQSIDILSILTVDSSNVYVTNAPNFVCPLC